MIRNKKEKKHFFGRKKKEDINIFEEDMEFVEDEDFDTEEYSKSVTEIMSSATDGENEEQDSKNENNEEENEEENIEDVLPSDQESADMTQESDHFTETALELEPENDMNELNTDQSEEDPNEKKSSGFHRFRFKKSKKDKNKEEAQEESSEDNDAGTEEESTTLSDDALLYDDSEDKKKVSKKKVFITLAAAVVVIGAVAFFMVRNIHSGSEGSAYVESVREIVGLGSGNGMNNRYTGTVEAQNSWKISLQSDMSVEKCYVSVGDEVKKGDKLFKYNTEELKLNLDKKQLEIETLQNEITQLNKDIKSYQSDLKSASASEKIELQTQILTAQTTIKKDEFTVKSDKEELKTIKSNIKDATVTSKMDGLVKKINESLGQSSSADDESTDASSDGSTYMTILAVGDYRVKGKISETNVWAINEGDAVIVRSRVDSEKTWSGTIKSVKTDATATEDDSSDANTDDMSMDDSYGSDTSSGETASTYNFYVELADDTDLMMGQHVFIEEDTGQDTQKEGIWLPSAYIKIDGNNYYVWASNARDRLVLQKIKVGEYDEDLDEYQVTDGLDLDDYIACNDDSLKENMKTTKVDASENTGEFYEQETSDDSLYYDESIGAEGDTSDYSEDYSEESYENEYDDTNAIGDDGIVDSGSVDGNATDATESADDDYDDSLDVYNNAGSGITVEGE